MCFITEYVVSLRTFTTGLIIQQSPQCFYLNSVVSHPALRSTYIFLLWHCCLSFRLTNVAMCLLSAGSYKLQHVSVVWPRVMGKPNPRFSDTLRTIPWLSPQLSWVILALIRYICIWLYPRQHLLMLVAILCLMSLLSASRLGLMFSKIFFFFL